MKSISLLFFVCFGQLAWGQVSGKIAGANGQPVFYATVALITVPDSSIAGSTLSDSLGLFKLAAPAGKYRLRISCLGYQNWSSAILEGRADIGTITLKEGNRQLQNVTISGARPMYQQTAGGTVVNVENSVLSKGSSALAILERSPGVVVDHQHNEVMLNGKSGVMIMINGKQVRMPADQVVTLLNGLNGDELSKIELLTAPGAAYDAEGSAGVINLVLKKSRKSGNSGSVTLNAGYGYGEKAGGSVNLEHTAGNTTVYGSYSFTHNRSYTDFTARATELEPLLGGPTSSVYNSVTRPVSNDHNLLLGADFKTGPKTTMGASLNYLNSGVSLPTVNTGIYHVQPDSLYFLNASSVGVNHWQSILADYELKQQIGTSQLAFSADYLDYRNHYPTTAASSFLSDHGYPAGSNDTLFAPVVKTYSNTHIQVGVAQLDFIKEWGQKLKIESGIKENYTQTGSVSGIESLVNGSYILEPTANNNMLMREAISAGYTSFTARLDSTTNLVAGLRYEYSGTRMTNPQSGVVIADRRLGKFFPNLLLAKKVGDDELTLAYSSRISRPSYTDLASFVTYNGPTSVNTGNPLLLPTLTNSLKLGFHHPLYSLALLISRDDHPIARYQIVESPDHTQLEVAPENMVYQDNVTLQAGFPLSVTHFWDMNSDLSGGWRKFKENFTLLAAGKSYFTYNLHSSQVFRLPAKWLIELSGYYNGPSYSGSRKYDGYGVLNAGFRKSFKNNAGSLQFSVDDLLETGGLSSYFGSLTEEAFHLKSHVIHQGEASKCRIFRLSYTISFGQGHKTMRTSNIQDEKNRINN